MIDHISLQTDDFAAATAWYDAVLAPLGYARVMNFGGVAGYGPADAHRLQRRGSGRGAGLPPGCGRTRRRGAARATGLAGVPPGLLRCFRPRPGRKQCRGRLPPAGRMTGTVTVPTRRA